MPRNAIAKLEDGCPPWAEGLSDRERAFVESYIVDLNPTEAAVRAKLGKTRKSSTEIASRMRKKPAVAAAISQLMSERTGVTGAAVVNEIARIAFAKMPDFARVENGALVITDTDQLTEDQCAAISEISETVGEGGARTVRVKLHDKLVALDKMAKVLSLYKERVEVSGPNGGPIEHEHRTGRCARAHCRAAERDRRANQRRTDSRNSAAAAPRDRSKTKPGPRHRRRLSFSRKIFFAFVFVHVTPCAFMRVRDQGNAYAPLVRVLLTSARAALCSNYGRTKVSSPRVARILESGRRGT